MLPRVSLCSALVSLGMLSSSVVQAAELKLARSYVGSQFESGFDFFVKDDPTNGFVDYVSLAVAKSMSLVSSTATSFKMAVDASTAVATGRGRKSVRIVSKDEYADGVYVLDVSHMPVGCATWPAFWTTVLDGWPTGGEIDIIEGSNAFPPTDSISYGNTFTTSPNLTGISLTRTDVASLHTISQCNLDDNKLGVQTGVQESTFCDATTQENIGCGVKLGNGTWGNEWNAGGGGLYVMWRDFVNSGQIYIYTFPRSATNVPAELLTTSSPTKALDPSTWSVTPNANFSIPHCPSSTFLNHAIVFNIALCGALAGNTFVGSGCSPTGQSCEGFVRGTPRAFGEAYWDVNALRVYTKTGKAEAGASLKSGLKTWQYALIGVGAALVAGLVIFLACCLLVRKRRRAAHANGGSPSTHAAGPKVPFTSRPLSSVPQLKLASAASSKPSPPSSMLHKKSQQSLYDSKESSPSDSDVDSTPVLATTTASPARRGSGKPASTYSAHNPSSLRRPSAPFVENPDGSNILRRGSAAATAVDPSPQSSGGAHRRGSVPFAIDRPLSGAPGTYDLNSSPAPSIKKSGAGGGRMSKKSSNPGSGYSSDGSARAPIITADKSQYVQRPPTHSSSGGFFAPPERIAAVNASVRQRGPPSAPAPLKVGDGGSVWRDPHAPIEGETPAVGSMVGYNSAGLSGGSRRGSASVATANGVRRGSNASGQPSPLGAGRRGSQSSAEGGGGGMSRKGSAQPVINGSRRSSMSSNGGGKGRRVSFGNDTARGDDTWEDTVGGGDAGRDGWGDEPYEPLR